MCDRDGDGSDRDGAEEMVRRFVNHLADVEMGETELGMYGYVVTDDSGLAYRKIRVIIAADDVGNRLEEWVRDNTDFKDRFSVEDN